MNPADRWAPGRWWLVGCIALAWCLRLPVALQNRFHPDEALYGYWGLLIGRGGDPWLSTVPVYKPPIFPYLMAASYWLFGGSEFALRYVGLAAGILMVPLGAVLAHTLYAQRWVSTLTGFLVTLSPFAILFCGTAFPDPLMVALGMAACLSATRGHSVTAGLLAGLSFAVKQTGLVWMPLALLLGFVRADGGRVFTVRFLAAFVLPVGLTVVWDRVRVARGATSYWRLGIESYGGLRLVWSQELVRRFSGWLGLFRYLFVSPVLNALAVCCGPILLVRGVVEGRRIRSALADLLLTMFVFTYVLFHWLGAFPVWDRYLLPLVPVLALLLARFLGLLIDRLAFRSGLGQGALSVVALTVLFVSLAAPSIAAAHSQYPVGGDHGMYDGIDEVAAFLRGQPQGTVVYQHWLGWHYDYHLFGAQLFVAYWPTPDWLARDIQAFGEREPRYIAFPSWESPFRVVAALKDVGYDLKSVLTTTRRDGSPSFTVYRIVLLQ